MNKSVTPFFSEELWKDVTSLIEQLNVNQSLWLSDYLKQSVSAAAGPTTAQKRAAVVYGSETGNSKAIANQFADKAQKSGKPIELIDLAELKPRQLNDFHQLFIICSTHGDGDPPEPITEFHRSLLESVKPLKDLKYAVLALGDSSYEKFCETGKQIDQKLAELSAIRLLERVDCDVDFNEQAESWIEESLNLVEHSDMLSPTSALVTRPTTAVSKAQPLSAEVLENICLTATHRLNAVHHLELDLDNAVLDIEAGDSIGVLPHNPPVLVNKIMTLLGFSGDETVSVNEQSMPLNQALKERYDLTIVSAKFITKWSKISEHEALQQLAEQESKIIRAFLKENQLVDLLLQFGGKTDAQSFVSALRPLQPRLYDVANSFKQNAKECHLTVERHQYSFNDRKETGIASDYLCDLNVGATVQIYPQANKRFRLPMNPAVPLILIADGTGIAPYRAFLQSFKNDESRQHQTWLILQEKHFQDDFLYQIEWLKALETGDLTRLNGAFTADVPGTRLIDCITDNYETFKGWLKAGAHVYLSGHKPSLEQFESELNTISHSDPGILDEWQQLADQGRIHRNLY